MADKPTSLQHQFLNTVRRTKAPVVMFLIKGVKLQGVITWFDAFSLLLRREGASQLVYKHAISTIMPQRPMDPLPRMVPQNGGAALQDAFLAAAAREGQDMTMFLVNGVMLQGKVVGYGQFSMLLERAGQVQLVYKHAISTIQPAHALTLDGEQAADEQEAAPE